MDLDINIIAEKMKQDLDLTNEYNLAQQSLQIAEKELLRSRQSSFSDKKEKASQEIEVDRSFYWFKVKT